MTILFHHPSAVEHRTPPGHPERPERMRAVETALAAEAFQNLDRRLPEPADIETVALAHPEEWVRAIIDAAPKEGLVGIDSDTVLSPGTINVVLRGVGAAVQGVDAVMAGGGPKTLSAPRPPRPPPPRPPPPGVCFFFQHAPPAPPPPPKHPGARGP